MTHPKRFRPIVSLLTALAVSAALSACLGGGGDDDDEGDIQLPRGVQISTEISGGENNDGTYQVDVTLDRSNYVRIFLTLENTTSTPQQVVIPACFTFVSAEGDTQDGLSIWRREITVAAGGKTKIMLGTYCMNSGRSAPHNGETYTLGGTTDVQDLKTLCEILRNRIFDSNSSVQSMVWKVTGGDRLSEADLTNLRAIAAGKALPSSYGTPPSKEQLLSLIAEQR